MKNILVVVDGTIGKTFLNRIRATKATKNRYYVIYYDDTLSPQEKIDNFLYYKLDPTSFSKISAVLKSANFYQVMLALSNKQDVLATCENVKMVNPKLNIFILDRWKLDLEQTNITLIEADDILSNRFLNYLPNIPVFAQEVGIGIGEIMHISIPFTSSYAYKHIGSIAQSRWHIAAVYRNKRLILPKKNLMLLPNDSIVVVGNPSVLQGVYRRINREFGQFPQPFGENLYIIIDMKSLSQIDIDTILNNAMLLHSKFNNHQLIMRVINPTLSDSFDKLKSYRSDSMIVDIEYSSRQLQDIVNSDIKNYDIGLVIVGSDLFKTNIEFFYNIKLPIFKIANSGFLKVENSVVLNESSLVVESVSSVLFDISSQLELDIVMFEATNESDESEIDRIREHYDSLSKLFERTITTKKLKINPILELKRAGNYLQFVLFEYKLIEKSMFKKIFSTDADDYSTFMSNNFQIFIPKL
jgi:hypothetical protein